MAETNFSHDDQRPECSFRQIVGRRYTRVLSECQPVVGMLDKAGLQRDGLLVFQFRSLKRLKLLLQPTQMFFASCLRPVRLLFVVFARPFDPSHDPLKELEVDRSIVIHQLLPVAGGASQMGQTFLFGIANVGQTIRYPSTGGDPVR